MDAVVIAQPTCGAVFSGRITIVDKYALMEMLRAAREAFDAGYTPSEKPDNKYAELCRTILNALYA